MMSSFIDWAKQNSSNDFKIRAIVTELGVSNNPNCLNQLNSMLDYMKKNSDVYAGFTYWAGGPAWSSYSYSIEPDNLTSGPDKPQMDIIRKYFS
jgi:endoglucanase